MKSIIAVKDIVSSLKKSERELFERIFEIEEGEASIIIPSAVKPLVEKYGSLQSFVKQKIVRIKNRFSQEETTFNEVRSKRPIGTKGDPFRNYPINELIEESKRDCVFCEERVTLDKVGKIERETCYTCANLASYAPYNSLAVAKWHNPFLITPRLISDYLDAANEWWQKVYKKDPKAKYPSLGWNCGPKAGASQIHGHIQLILSYWPDRAAKEAYDYTSSYQKIYKSNYWDDLFTVHKMLGLSFSCEDAQILASLTPQLDKEVKIIAESLDELKQPIYRCLQLYLELEENFNLAVWAPPKENLWKNFPYVVGIQSRGNLKHLGSNSGVRESSLVKTPIITTDPFKLAQQLLSLF